MCKSISFSLAVGVMTFPEVCALCHNVLLFICAYLPRTNTTKTAFETSQSDGKASSPKGLWVLTDSINVFEEIQMIVKA